MKWFDDCPFCSHPMMFHDGDGASEHYSCCKDDCACRWEWSPSDKETDYEPLSLMLPIQESPFTKTTKEQTMSDLTKTRTVLRHNGFIARHTADIERGPVFDSSDEDGARLTIITLDQSVWEDMGSPSEITVTVEPGDRLNEYDPAAKAVDAEAERAFNEDEGARSE